MPNLLKNTKTLRWWPDADSVNAPDQALLLADNLVPDPEAMLALRKGSVPVFSGLQSLVHSLYSREVGGRTYRFAGAGSRLYRNGMDFGIDFAGSGDIAMGDDSYQAFFARGTTKKKFDGTNFYNWAVGTPDFPAALTAVTAITTTVATFNSTESPAFVINEGTSSFVAGFDGTASGALKLVPAASGRASASKVFASDQNFFNILGADGGDTDLFDVYIWIEEPNNVDKVTIMFGLGTGSDAYRDDYYYFDFSIRDPSTVDVKDAGSTAVTAFSAITNRVQSVLTPQEVSDVKTPAQVEEVLRRLGRFAGPRSRERKDAQEASPAWTHLSVTRGQFNRVGGTAGRDWSTVRAFKVVYTARTGNSTAVQFDNAVWTGGGGRSLTGKYKVGYRFVRNFNGIYQELGPISPISKEIQLTQQALQVTIPAAALSGKDPQVNEIWVYLDGGFLDTYYRVAVVSATVRQGMTIDELTNPAGSDFNTAGERTRLTAWGFTRISGDTSASDLIFTINKSEVQALVENERLEPGSVGPPDNIIAVAGPFNGRMFVLTAEGRLYPSHQLNPTSYSLYQHLDLRKYGDPFWLVLTSGGLYAGFSKDIIRVGGTGEESDSGLTADFTLDPLHVGNPPVDQSAVTDGNSVVYRSIDGLMLLTGASLTPVPSAGTELLWRGQKRHGVEALNVGHGRFRFAIDNHVLLMLAPEGPLATPPGTSEENVVWSTLTGFSKSNDVLTKTATTGYNNTTATGSKVLASADGHVRAVATEVTTERYFGLTAGLGSGGDPTKIDFAIRLDAIGQLSIVEDGLVKSASVAPYVTGDVLTVELSAGTVYYRKNGLLVYTSTITPGYPMVADVAMNQSGSTLGPLTISGNWTLVDASSGVIWRLDLNKQQWARTTYPVQVLSFSRDPNGDLLAGTNDGRVWQLDVGAQDNGQNIPVNFLTPVLDGGDPLARKDPLDLQVHADTGSRTATINFYLDGASSVKSSFSFSSDGPDVGRFNVLGLGPFLKMQVGVTGTFSRLLLHLMNLQFRNRVQQVMVLDTGTISPKGNNRLTWIAEAEIDCISPVDLYVDLYLDDLLKSTQTIAVLPNRRHPYRFELPRGSKAGAPRLVFRSTNSDGTGHRGFEPYQVRVRDRGTGTAAEAGFRPVWPVGTAP